MKGAHRSSPTLSAALFAAGLVVLIAGVAPLGAARRVPAGTLYDQFGNPGSVPITSQDFETSFDIYDSEAADDFVVPPGVGWNVDGVDVQGVYYNGPGPADSVHVRFYTNAGATNLPDTLVCEWLNQPYTGGASFVVTLSPACSVGAGHYWVSVQARMDFGGGHGQWGWTARTVQSNAGGAWRLRNPGGCWECTCPTWQRRTTCIFNPPDPDQVYRLRGTCLATYTGASCAPGLRLLSRR